VAERISQFLASSWAVPKKRPYLRVQRFPPLPLKAPEWRRALVRKTGIGAIGRPSRIDSMSLIDPKVLTQPTITILTVSVICAPPVAEPAIITTGSPGLAIPDFFNCATANSQSSSMSSDADM